MNISGARISLRLDYESQNAAGRTISKETRYYVTSLDPEHVTSCDLYNGIRNHWQIENSLHFTKDRWWDEDRHHTRRPGLAEVFASLNNAALGALRLLKSQFEPLRACADKLQWKPARALNLLGFV